MTRVKTPFNRNILLFVATTVLMVMPACAGSGNPTTNPGTTQVPTTPATTPPATTPPITTTTPPVVNGTFTFDFDTGSPVLGVGQSIPFSQTVGGVVTEFSSTFGAAYSIQNQASTDFILSQFSGKYLYDNDVSKSSLQLKFSQRINSITISFATVDSHGPGNVETPTEIRLNAYVDSATSSLVGTATARGAFTTDTYPQGIISFNSNLGFNLITLETEPVLRGASAFFIDRITITVN
ncbi:hypothetical protein ABFB09_03925 [Dehalogenimonas sp. THU2]|uniref:hypothetical protein n=1 Tax=Dehalogenimonas sp. THU2 TaxID=3151121 RepID=UPI003218C6F3